MEGLAAVRDPGGRIYLPLCLEGEGQYTDIRMMPMDWWPKTEVWQLNPPHNKGWKLG